MIKCMRVKSDSDLISHTQTEVCSQYNNPNTFFPSTFLEEKGEIEVNLPENFSYLYHTLTCQPQILLTWNPNFENSGY